MNGLNSIQQKKLARAQRWIASFELVGEIVVGIIRARRPRVAL